MINAKIPKNIQILYGTHMRRICNMGHTNSLGMSNMQENRKVKTHDKRINAGDICT